MNICLKGRSMRVICGLALCFLLSGFAGGAAEAKKLLVVTVTTGFRHSSISTAEKILSKLAQESGAFTVEFVRQPEVKVKQPSRLPGPAADEEMKAKYKAEMEKYLDEFRPMLKKLSADNLKNYDGLIFANTTGDLPVPDPQAIVNFVKNGGAFIGMHSATDTFHGFKPFIDMIGGEFLSHGAQVGVECLNEDKKHPACAHLPTKWNVYDEIYILKSFTRSSVHCLLTLDREPNKKTPGDFPIAWCKEFGAGKVFYTSLGHREDIWDDQTPANFDRKNSTEISLAYQKHILGGIKWALGLVPGDGKPGQ